MCNKTWLALVASFIPGVDLSGKGLRIPDHHICIHETAAREYREGGYEVLESEIDGHKVYLIKGIAETEKNQELVTD